MQHRHMRRHHRGGFHFLIKIMMVFLIFGALFSQRTHGRQALYWEGYRDGAQSQAAQSADAGAPVQPSPPLGPQDWGGPHFRGPGIGALLFVPLCGLALLGFMGFLFAIRRGTRRRGGQKGPWADGGPWPNGGPWGHGKSWGRCGPWSDDMTTDGRQVDEDEIGPEKDPNDYL